jgi:glycosyl hydrolase family 79
VVPAHDTIGRLTPARLLTLAVIWLGLASLLVVVAPARRSVARHSTRAATQVSARSAPRRAMRSRAEVTIGVHARMQAVPRSFLGLSTEYWALPLWERRASLLGRMLSLLRVPGDGPLVLRIGGDSADETFWKPRMHDVPDWVVGLKSSWLREVGAIVHRSRVRLILDLNLVTATPAIAAQWARAAETALPPRSIAGFEIGNEPDLYDRAYWLSIVSGTNFGRESLPVKLSAAVYARDFRSYARALSAATPGVPLLGPAVANPSRDVSWISRLLAGPHPGLRTVSVHRYQYSACALRGSQSYPTIARLLSDKASTGMAQALRSGVEIARRAGLPYRLTELNSVTCGGRPGVSDTFATALWAPDALFELLRAGVDAVNLHVRPRTVNAAFSLTGKRLTVHPLLYGLLLFARTLGSDSHLVQLRLQAKRSLHLKAWGVRGRGDAMHVLVINKGSQSVTVALHLPGTGPATVQRMLAPSVGSRSGVTIDGQWLSADGAWEGRRTTEKLSFGAQGYALAVPRLSAALVSVRLAS